MTAPDRQPPDVAAMGRRAAALFLHYRRMGDLSTDGILAVLDEMDGMSEAGGIGGEPWIALVMSLLQTGNQMAAAARDGREDEYLQHVVQQASLDEVAGP